ncbi:HAMP domain-containing sensor histidine kinase [Conexibacter sp. JD483]|uniref:sensor histidine kinase n=1 Tax=unclassified Conexibacter TaxID=2627773 RepID=UPI0027233127|nr:MULTISPECIES: HAMP domain-containing sensor histidine kinase [unclassified Conexibacter]MDO8184398.1 HAMP domain-containing sensor histidine kinase [Conexibacter sp. CPCC 205706]MDO8197704.1 HAMP domain-containing sensor histidine kinase [Conexibacter sp. CPCC 205762]MDR9368367.1 HAMP domain-containing sensor histidine kinase [Conexibacter sp. JD483]
MRSLRNRLAFLFFAITLAAIAALYLYIAPQLETRLRDEKVTQLREAAQGTIGDVRRAAGTDVPTEGLDEAVSQAGDRANARLTLLRVNSVDGAPQLERVSDSVRGGETLDQGIAEGVLRDGRTASAVTRSLAIVAVPVADRDGRISFVALYSTPTSDVEGNVAVVRQQILIAGAIALALAVLAGWLVARALAQRVKRLEEAAEQVAAGDFSRPIPVDSDDELGQLARAFNDMQRQLAQLDRARKQFIATASHELRTPLFSLGGFVELLEDEELDEETRRRFIGQLRLQVERLRKLTVDLLDLSRLEAGSLELRPEPVDLSELASAVSSEFEPVLAQRDAHLEVRLTGRAVEALCDPVRVAQIMRILIDNALTHSPAGTDIVVSATRDDGFARLAVRDHGKGIERQALSQIFEPFYTTDDAQGSGLGLAIASELAERMRGRLGVESRPGRTVFTLELPA